MQRLRAKRPKDGIRIESVTRSELKLGDAIEEGLDRDLGLHPRQERPRADMGTGTEGDVIPRSGAIEPEPIGVGVDALVAVCRGDAVKQPLSLLDENTINFNILGAGSGQQLNRGIDPQ